MALFERRQLRDSIRRTSETAMLRLGVDGAMVLLPSSFIALTCAISGSVATPLYTSFAFTLPDALWPAVSLFLGFAIFAATSGMFGSRLADEWRFEHHGEEVRPRVSQWLWTPMKQIWLASLGAGCLGLMLAVVLRYLMHPLLAGIAEWAIERFAVDGSRSGSHRYFADLIATAVLCPAGLWITWNAYVFVLHCVGTSRGWERVNYEHAVTTVLQALSNQIQQDCRQR